LLLTSTADWPMSSSTRCRRRASASPMLAVSTASMGLADALMPLGPRLLLGFLRTIIVRNLRVVGRDLTAMEQELATSGLDCYAGRPVKLTDGLLTERVQAGERFAMRAISRADVAWYLLRLAEATEQPLTRTPILIPASRHQMHTRAEASPQVASVQSQEIGAW